MTLVWTLDTSDRQRGFRHQRAGGRRPGQQSLAPTIVEDGHVERAASSNLTTVTNFQPVGGGSAAINDDFILTAPEVQKVIQALRAGNIQIVELCAA
jgi:Domain of Unknown Function (DUF1259)